MARNVNIALRYYAPYQNKKTKCNEDSDAQPLDRNYTDFAAGIRLNLRNI